MAQVNVDASSVVDPLKQLNRKAPILFGRDNQLILLVQEKAKRMDSAVTRLQLTDRVKSQEETMRNKVAVSFSLGETPVRYISDSMQLARQACLSQCACLQKYHSSKEKAKVQLGRAYTTHNSLEQVPAQSQR